MARNRSIHPNMWSDEAFVSLSFDARLALLTLGTICDSRDLFTAASQGFDAVCRNLPELVGAGLVTWDGSTGEVIYAFGFNRRRVSRWERLRQFIFDRDGRACTYCGAADEPLHCDHVVPASRGGSNEPENLTTACKPCNLSKHDRTPEEWLNFRTL